MEVFLHLCVRVHDCLVRLEEKREHVASGNVEGVEES